MATPAAPLGALLIADGVSRAAAGTMDLCTGTRATPLFEQGLQGIGFKPETASNISTGLSIGGCVVGAWIVAEQLAVSAAARASTRLSVGLSQEMGGIEKISRVDLVINETMQGKGMITSRYQISVSEALQAEEKFLESNYKEIGKSGSGVFRSGDGLRQFRMDINSLLGRHRPWEPHVHLEVFNSQNLHEAYINNHILIIE